jgi:hypothetical protein
VVRGLFFVVRVLGAFPSASRIAWIHPFRMFEAHCTLLFERVTKVCLGGFSFSSREPPKPRRRSSSKGKLSKSCLELRENDQQQPHGLPRNASLLSQTMRGTTANAATGSAQATCQTAFTTSPSKAIRDRYAHKPD